MTEWYQWALPVIGGAVMWVAWRVPRAAVWVMLLLTSFVLSSLWWDLGGPMPAAFAASTDFAVALIMLRYKRKEWETDVLYCYCGMILAHIVWHAGLASSHYWYALWLEIMNWTIVLLIGALGVADRLQRGRDHRRHRDGRSVGLLGAYPARENRYPRWWRKAE
jgi:hypothetical protein